jgi:hypothetical protein
MRLSVATNFDPVLVDALRGYPVVELFGKLREDAVGGGRAPYQFAPVSRSQLAAHVRHDVECETCRWCHDFAAKAVRVDPEASRRALAAYDELFRSLDGGAMWRYLPDGIGRGGS